jgi:hypothetical protein
MDGGIEKPLPFRDPALGLLDRFVSRHTKLGISFDIHQHTTLDSPWS